MPQQKWSNTSSSKYLTDEMLSTFTSDFLPTSQVELTISCRNLINTDLLSKSDPYCLISMKESWQDQFYDIGRTETINDTLNPQWVTKLILNYNFETTQKIKFEVRDEDLQGFDFLGTFHTTLGELASFSGRQYFGKLKGMSNQDFGEIIIVTEEVSSCKQIAELHFRAEHLPKLGWICNNDPFLVLSRSNEDGSYSVVAKTEPDKNTQSPRWKPITIRATTICNGDFERNIKIDCYDNRKNGSHKIIGTCYTNLRSLTAASGNESKMILINEAKQKANSNEASAGEIHVDKAILIEEFTFLDYIRNGTQMHFAVAIDFTASNGRHTDPNSLHFLSPGRMNNYEISLRAVGEIIQHYDSSQLFPAFGFGAKLPSGHVSHQFPLNGNQSHPYCSGVDEILNHYRQQLNTVQLHGPTNFAPVINNTSSIARQFQDGRHYFVLLIITDGIISDMHQTKRAIINASFLPISIIIVGVGSADFGAMDELDSDDVRLSAEGRLAERDIVQFVPLNKFLSNNGSYVKSQADLAKEVLAEIPAQLTGFMKAHGIQPQRASFQMPPGASQIMPTAPMS